MERLWRDAAPSKKKHLRTLPRAHRLRGRHIASRAAARIISGMDGENGET